LEQVNKVTIPFFGQPLEFVHILLQPFIFFAYLLLTQLSIGSAIDLQSTTHTKDWCCEGKALVQPTSSAEKKPRDGTYTRSGNTTFHSGRQCPHDPYRSELFCLLDFLVWALALAFLAAAAAAAAAAATHDDAIPQPNNIPTMLVVDLLGALFALSSPQDDAVVLDSPAPTEDDLVGDVGVSDVDEDFGRFEARGVKIGEGLSEAGLLEEVERCYVLDVVERHFRGTIL
jgi:hypothetical protein